MRQHLPALANHSRIPVMTLFWAVAALPGLIALGWLLRVPSEPEAAFFLGFSLLRLLLAGGVLVLILVFLGLAGIAATRSPAWQRLDRLSERFLSAPQRAYTLLVLLVTFCAAALALLALMASSAGDHSRFLIVAADRAGVVILWLFLLLAQLSGWVYYTLYRQAETEGADNNLPRPLWLPLLFAVAVVFIAALRAHTSIPEAESDWPIHLSLLLLFGVPLGWVIARLVNDRETAAVFTVWAAVLFVGGALFWAWFINFGEGPFIFHDWKEVSIPRLIVLQNAFSQGELPLHISVGPALLNVTDRFMSIPDLLLAPQVLLLKWMEVKSFVVINLLLTYSAGFAGLISISRRYKLSIIPFTLLFLLFTLNGHIAAHIAVGHYIWATAYFLLPWLVVLIFRLLEGHGGWMWVLQTAALLFVIFLHGGYHYLVYALALLALIAMLIPRCFRIAIQAIVFTVLLCAFRLLPLATNADTFTQHIGYLDGFRSLLRLVESIAHGSFPYYAPDLSPLAERVGTWELTYYIGLAGLVFFIVFGIFAVFRNQTNPLRVLLLPAFGLLLLSLDGIYQNLLVLLPLPPLTGERVAARFFLLAFLIVIALATIEFQRWYDRQNPSKLLRVGSVMVCLLLAHDLWQNFQIWQIEQTAQTFRTEAIDITKLVIANHPDPEYTTALAVGAVVTLGTLLVLAFLAWREKKRTAHRRPKRCQYDEVRLR